MPPKAVPAAQVLVLTAITSGPLNTQSNTNMAKSSEQSVK